MAPEIENSTVEQRREFIKKTYWCRSDCDNCGICQVFGGKDPLVVFADYIEGKEAYLDISKRYR